MLNLILIMSLFPQQGPVLAQKAQTKTVVAQVVPCVWPNKCAEAPKAAAVPVTTCQWPNVCGEAVAQIQTCQWPNKCAGQADGPVHTCDYPNKCS